MAKTCPDCGCRVYEYGCVNCNEQDYTDMEEYENEQIAQRSLKQAVSTSLPTGAERGTPKP